MPLGLQHIPILSSTYMSSTYLEFLQPSDGLKMRLEAAERLPCGHPDNTGQIGMIGSVLNHSRGALRGISLESNVSIIAGWVDRRV